MPVVTPAQHDRSSMVPWSKTDPKLREWVEANRPAVDLFQQGAEQSDGISRPAGESYSERFTSAEPGWLIWLVLAEGGRREESGHMAGAWDCYRAVLRMTAHVRRRGSLFDRAVANTHHDSLRKRLATWAVDPRTTIPQLRRAIEEAVESRPKPEWDSFSLKIEYLDLMQFLEHPDDRTFEPLEDDGDEKLRGALALRSWRRKRGYRELVVLLARELYHRERGGVHLWMTLLVGLILRACPMTVWASSMMESWRPVSDSYNSSAAPLK